MNVLGTQYLKRYINKKSSHLSLFDENLDDIHENVVIFFRISTLSRAINIVDH